MCLQLAEFQQIAAVRAIGAAMAVVVVTVAAAAVAVVTTLFYVC